MFKHLRECIFLMLFCCSLLYSSDSYGQVSLVTSPYSENFDNLGSGYPTGWTGIRAAGSGEENEVLVPVESNGSSSSGAIYNVGIDTDRALATLASGTTMPMFGASFQNNTGSVLNLLKVSADMEQWKSGSSSTSNETIKFEYSLNATSIHDEAADWIAVSDLDLNEILIETTSAAAVNGNTNSKAITAELTGLNWGNNTIIWIRWSDYNDSGSDGMYGIDNFKVEFNSNTTTPAVYAPSSLNLGETLMGNTITGQYSFSASNLTSDVVITTAAPFEVSKTDGNGYTSSITFTSAELTSPQTVYVRATPTSSGQISGTILHASNGAQNAELSIGLSSFSPYEQEFSSCTGGSGLTGGWMQYSITGAQTWECTTYGKEGNGVQMNGYSGGNNENEDWLISPSLDLTTFAKLPVLTIDYRTKYSGEDLVVKVSTDYSGSGNPAAATWTTLLVLDADNADVWKTLQGISLADYKAANTYVAFVYTSTTTASARWTLDNFKIENKEQLLNYSSQMLRFDETAVGNASAAQAFELRALGFTENVVVTAPVNFEVSKDNVTFASSVTFTAAEAANANTLYLRFKPTEAKAKIEGQLSITSGSATENIGYLYGSSILKENTLDIVTWNLEWFGSASNGPEDDVQFANAKTVIQKLDADIIALQEIVDESQVQKLALETGYAYESMTMTAWQDAADQKLGFLYKPGVVSVKKEKVILAKLYADIKAGAATLTDYPGGNSSFLWSSGRLPYMVQFEATISGAKQLYNLVNLHAKATVNNPEQDYQRRKYDAQVLADTLAAQYANANLVILGDFNDDVDVSVVSNYASPFEVFVNNSNYSTLTYDLSASGAVTYKSSSLSSFLDHIVISSTLTDEYVGNSIMINEQFDEEIENYRNSTSDHAPVSARFFVNSEVTTGIADATKGQFSVYPNPAQNHVRLALPAKVGAQQSINLSVWSVDGRMMFETTGKLTEANHSLNRKVSTLKEGVYIIRIMAGNEAYQARLLKN